MRGGAPRVVWTTLGLDPRTISAHSAAQRLIQHGKAPHLVWNPVNGETVQLIPIGRAGCSLVAAAEPTLERPLPDMYSVEPITAEPSTQVTDAHTQGRLCVQLGVIAFGWEPFTSGPVSGLGPILDWFGSWGIPRRWPAGRPAPFACAHTIVRSRKLWARGGHYGASQVPGCMAAGPGAIDIEMLTGAPAAHGVEIPLPRVADGLQRERPAPVSPAAVSRVGNVLADSEPGGLLTAGEPAGALARAG